MYPIYSHGGRTIKVRPRDIEGTHGLYRGWQGYSIIMEGTFRGDPMDIEKIP